MLTRYILFLGLLMPIIGCHTADSVEQEKPAFTISDSLYKTLQISNVALCPLESTITLSGRVSFNEDKMAKVYPMMSGTISGIKFQLGDYVRANQQLGIIKSVEMIGLETDIQTAQTQLNIAKKNWEAAEVQYKNGLISQKEFITAELLFHQAEADLNKAQSILKINGGNSSGNYIIHSPISGFVVEKDINNYMVIRPDNSSSLFTISDLSKVWVMANVYESEISKINLGDPVIITTLAYPGKKWDGKIDKIFNILDKENKVMKVCVVLDNPKYLLKPEMFATIRVEKKEAETVLCVPSSSIIFDADQYFVLSANDPGKIKIVPVNVISKTEDITFISGALNPNDSVISSNVLLIYGALHS